MIKNPYVQDMNHSQGSQWSNVLPRLANLFDQHERDSVSSVAGQDALCAILLLTKHLPPYGQMIFETRLSS
jgi:hypothetical protein